MTKQQYYNNKRNQFLNGVISLGEWQRFCFLYLFTDQQFIEVCKRLSKT